MSRQPIRWSFVWSHLICRRHLCRRLQYWRPYSGERPSQGSPSVEEEEAAAPAGGARGASGEVGQSGLYWGAQERKRRELLCNASLLPPAASRAFGSRASRRHGGQVNLALAWRSVRAHISLYSSFIHETLTDENL